MSDTVALGDHKHINSVVYFVSNLLTLSCCQKYSLENLMWINPQLKIVPSRCSNPIILLLVHLLCF